MVRDDEVQKTRKLRDGEGLRTEVQLNSKFVRVQSVA